MTWVNAGIVSAESKTILECKYTQSPSLHTTERPIYKLTGSDCIGSMENGLTFNLPSSYTCLRFGYWLYHYGPVRDNVYGYKLLTFVSTSFYRFRVAVSSLSRLCGFANVNSGSHDQPDPFYAYIPTDETTLGKLGEWQHYGFVMRPDDFTFFLNGQQIIQAANPAYSFDLKPLTHVATMTALSPNAISNLMDDFYMDKSDILEPVTAPPPLRFHPSYLQRTGAHDQWEAISPLEVPQEIFSTGRQVPATTTYYQSDTIGQRQTFKLGALDLPTGQTISGVGAQVYCDRDDRDIDLSIELGGVTADQPFAPNTRDVGGYEAPGLYMPLDPNGNPWTLDNLATCSVGVRSQ